MARRTTWVTTRSVLNVNNAAQGLLTLATGRSTTDSRNATIIRTIGHLWYASLTVAGAWGRQIVDLGIGIASQEAFAAGTVPDPNTSGDQPTRGWMYRDTVMVEQNGVGSKIHTESTFDIRSARRLDEGEPYIVFDNVTTGGTVFNVQITVFVRQLWLMP